MALLLLFCLLAVFGGFWIFFAVLWLMFRITFFVIGGVIGVIVGGVALLVAGLLGLVMLPLLGLVVLPFFFPLLLVAALVWALTRHPQRHVPITIRH